MELPKMSGMYHASTSLFTMLFTKRCATPIGI